MKNTFTLLRNKQIFFTGGTGFFGRWLLESFIHFNDNLNLKAKLFILSRNPEKFSIFCNLFKRG